MAEAEKLVNRRALTRPQEVKEMMNSQANHNTQSADSVSADLRIVSTASGSETVIYFFGQPFLNIILKFSIFHDLLKDFLV